MITFRTLATSALVVAALGVSACGDDGADTDKIQEQSEQLRQEGEQLRKDAEKTAEEVRSGEVSAEEAAEKLQKEADELADKAKTTASDAIEEAQKEDLPQDAQDQLDAAQEQLQQQTP